ncbi:MAG: hypothetical protein GY817_04285 [bacterium]|nr:hypothetical protein [bacterium]
MKKNIFFLIILSLLGLAYAAEAVEEVTVKAGVRMDIDSKKPNLSIEFDKNDYFRDITKIEKYVFNIFPESFTDVLPSMSKVVYSKNTIHPQHANILKDPIVIFRTDFLKDIFIKKWAFIITDARGEVFTKIKGKKDIPEVIEWSGADHKGRMIVPGQWYSYSIDVQDSFNEQILVSGETFRVKGLYFEDKKRNQIISLSLVDLFDLTSTKPNITTSGYHLLEEALDYIKFFYEYPIKIKVYAREEAIGYKYAEAVMDYIYSSLNAKEMVINLEVVPSYISEYRLDIFILNA